ncbi:MAG: ATP phosphoribosyltransferase regulatory subunit [Clostridia bacterium]|nr:ATP phosphoribosyltransferase regulatory subunit [Clostridia bacterium]
MTSNLPLKANENIIFSLRALYNSYGYSHYKMSKFEEYDLYSKNKDFLVSDSVITFTDTNGKLMALKPDVTLSIVKNTKDTDKAIEKLYYNENVYRVSKSTHTFKEIMQAGLECIGDVDDYCIFEVLSLALKSLFTISENSVLDISNLAVLKQVVDYIGIPDSERADVIRCIGEKNLHELSQKCKELGIPEEKFNILKGIVSLHGTPKKVFPKAEELLKGTGCDEIIENFKKIATALPNQQAVNVDFSVVDNVHYYNGIVFKGFIQGVPNSVLSGGQYDKLLKKMKLKKSAIGFAVYLDMLELLNTNNNDYDVDTVLVYDSETTFSEIEAQTEILRMKGSVLALCQLPKNIRCRKIVTVKKGEVISIENNA